MKIYVASSWKNNVHSTVVDLLRLYGHEVYDFKNPDEQIHGFTWTDIDVNWKHWTTEAYIDALSHPVAEAAFKRDFDAMKWADCCLMVLPCGRSANTEAGWMKGAGKSVFVFQAFKEEPELMYKIYDGILTTIEELEFHFKL